MLSSQRVVDTRPGIEHAVDGAESRNANEAANQTTANRSQSRLQQIACHLIRLNDPSKTKAVNKRQRHENVNRCHTSQPQNQRKEHISVWIPDFTADESKIIPAPKREHDQYDCQSKTTAS